MNRDTDTGVMALVLDRVMTDPAQGDLIQARLEDVPLADRDQLDAASREARGFIDAAVTAGIAAAAGKRQPWEVPEWVRLSLLTALVTWIQGKSVTCVHSPRPSRPEPVFAAAGKPGLMTCRQCAPLLFTAPSSPEDRVCDRCGGDADLYSSTVRLQALTFQLVVCEDCRFWERATTR